MPKRQSPKPETSMVDAGTLLAVTVDGIGIGAIYALVAMGFALINKITGVLNFAQGQLALLGAYGVVIFSSPRVIGIEMSPYLAIALTVVLGIILGYLLERVIFQHFIGEPILNVIIVTLALAGIFSGSIRLVAGPNFQPYPEAVRLGSFTLPFGATMRVSFGIAVILAILVVILLMVFFRYTVIGSILQATASDQQAAQLLGVSMERTIVIAWSISIVITFIGGILLGIATGGAGFSIEVVGIIIFAAVILGGLESVLGAFVGSIVVGVLQEYGSFYLEPIAGPGFGEVVPMIFLMIVILVLPYGIWGTERIERL